MKKLIGLILISLFLFSSSVFAEKWESAGTWGVASVEIDTDSILPVTPVHSSIPVRFTYQYTMKISSKNYSVTTTQVIDLRRNYRFILVVTLFVLASLAVSGRLVYLQVHDHEFLAAITGTEISRPPQRVFYCTSD